MFAKLKALNEFWSAWRFLGQHLQTGRQYMKFLWFHLNVMCIIPMYKQQSSVRHTVLLLDTGRRCILLIFDSSLHRRINTIKYRLADMRTVWVRNADNFPRMIFDYLQKYTKFKIKLLKIDNFWIFKATVPNIVTFHSQIAADFSTNLYDLAHHISETVGSFFSV